MTTHSTKHYLDIDRPKYLEAAANILQRHQEFDAEANITSAIRDFLVITGLARASQIVEETPPSSESRCAVDLTALDTFIEVKRRIGSSRGNDPDPQNIAQLDDYLAQSERDGKGVRMGVLTDGKHWILRWRGAGDVRTTYPYAFTLDSPEKWLPLYEWLRDKALVSNVNIHPNADTIEEHFGPNSPTYRRDIDQLRSLYDQHADAKTVKLKRGLWSDLLRAALGEAAESAPEQDDLFVRHTYLAAVVGMIVQASTGIDIYQLGESDPKDLLIGRAFRRRTGLQGVVESDFFTWPAEFGGETIITAIARRVAKFDWNAAPNDVASILYQCVIPSDERYRLGEYYTPEWLARTMVQEFVDDPLNQRVLDPACGSGTFIVEAVRRYIERARAAGKEPNDIFIGLRSAITGIDVHPVAVHLARASWILAAMPIIRERTSPDRFSPPIYLGDSLQLRYHNNDLFAGHVVAIQVENDENGDQNLELRFPRALVDDAEAFDGLMIDIADNIERGYDPSLALSDNPVHEEHEPIMRETAETLQRLHDDGRNHIWAYYIRNMVRPLSLSHSKVDVIIGNPPWLNYRNTSNVLRDALRRHSQHTYGIWTGGRYATHQDVAGLFFTRSADLYLGVGGKIGMVMPHSALQAGQYSKWRSGEWKNGNGNGQSTIVDFGVKPAWDLEKLEPNTFFPVAASVVFAERIDSEEDPVALLDGVERWLGKAGADDVRREMVGITDTSKGATSIYSIHARQGATIVPRSIFFVEEIENTATVLQPGTIHTKPRRGSQDKRPWRDLDLGSIAEWTIETQHVYDVHLGETVAPYVALEPLKAILPVKRDDGEISFDPDGPGGIRRASLTRLMRDRWQTMNRLWEENKPAVNKMNLSSRLNYYGKLSAQLAWQQGHGDRRVRVVYTSAGRPTAALLDDDGALVESKLFWIACRDEQEANYLLAVINSDVLAEAVNKYTTPNWAGNTRDLQKHLWKLPIPEFDAEDALHAAIAAAGLAAATGAAARLAEVRAEYGADVSVTIARRELRAWLPASPEGKAVEAAVGDLLRAE